MNKKSHILYIGYYTDDAVMYELQNRKINNMSVARQKFEKNLITELYKNCGDNCSFLSYVPCSEEFEIPECSELNGACITHISINRKSLPDMVHAMFRFSSYLEKLGKTELKNLKVIMYEVNPLFLIPMRFYQKKYGIQSCSIIAELSLFRRAESFIWKLRNYAFSWFERQFNAFILLSSNMAEVLHCEDKPFIVIEGLAPEVQCAPEQNKKNIVMYAGGLAKDNNVELLIDACSQVQELDELWICGCGEIQKIVEEKEKQYPFLKYFGMIPNDQVLEMEKKAKILANLRSPDNELFKYSFPSKTLEYMSSGTMVLSSRLPGIPDEYFNYLVEAENLTVQGVAEDIQRIFAMNEEEYCTRIVNGQKFLLEAKTASVQIKRMIEFLDAL